MWRHLTTVQPATCHHLLPPPASIWSRQGQAAVRPAQHLPSPPPTCKLVEWLIQKYQQEMRYLLGSSTTTAPPSLSPTASKLLEQCIDDCVAACGWCKLVLQAPGGRECLYFSCRPSKNIITVYTPCNKRPAIQVSKRAYA